MQSRLNEQQKAWSSKKFLFVQPNQNWPRPPAKFLSMEVVSTLKNGLKVMTFRKSPEYESLQHEFH